MDGTSAFAYNRTSEGSAAMSALPAAADMVRLVDEGLFVVESGCGAVAVGSAYLFPPLSSGGASIAEPLLRFHTPLIEPDVRYQRIRLSDKTSRLRTRKVTSSHPTNRPGRGAPAYADRLDCLQPPMPPPRAAVAP